MKPRWPAFGPATDGSVGARATTGILFVFLSLSVACNVLLAWKAISWHRIALAGARPAARRPPVLGVGTAFPQIVGKHLDGSAAAIRYGDANLPTVIYVLSPHCVWCSRNRVNLGALIKQGGGKFHLLCLSVTGDGLREYAERNHISGPNVDLVFDVSPGVLSDYQLTATPQTIVVSPEGKVLKVWQGAYQTDSQREIERFLGVQLPGTIAEEARPSKAM